MFAKSKSTTPYFPSPEYSIRVMNKFRPHTYCEMVRLGIESCAATQATAASRAETQAMAASSKARPRPRNNVVGGSFEYYIQQKNSREGPLDTAALGDYPHDFLERLFSGEAGFARRRRLEASLSRGTVVDTDFSGKGSVEVTLLLLDRALKDHCVCVCAFLFRTCVCVCAFLFRTCVCVCGRPSFPFP